MYQNLQRSSCLHLIREQRFKVSHSHHQLKLLIQVTLKMAREAMHWLLVFKYFCNKHLHLDLNFIKIYTFHCDTIVLMLLMHFCSIRASDGLSSMLGPWRSGAPLLGNILSLVRPDFHRVLLQWSDEYNGFYRQVIISSRVVFCPSSALRVLLRV